MIIITNFLLGLCGLMMHIQSCVKESFHRTLCSSVKNEVCPVIQRLVDSPLAGVT